MLTIGSSVPAYLNVVDIAGLVKGAHEGQVCIIISFVIFMFLQGLGNAFLSNISACDAIFHMTRSPLHKGDRQLIVTASRRV